MLVHETDRVVELFVDVCEAALNVDTGLSLSTSAGFSEACFQQALSSELFGSQSEVVREVPYLCQSSGRVLSVGHVRFDLVYGPLIIEIKSYRTKCKTSLPPSLTGQLLAYKALLRTGEVLIAVLFWKDGVDVFEYK